MTYVCIFVNYRLEKSDPDRVRLTVGGNCMNYPGNCGTPTANMLTVKLILNSVISTKGAKFMSIYIKNFYLHTPMAQYKYMRLKISELPQDFIDEYKLHDKTTKYGYMYLKIRKGMYGLPQAGTHAQKLLEKRLNARGYRQRGI